MKRIKLFILFAFISICSQQTQAQVDVTVNPVGLLFGDLSIGGDFSLADNFSIEGTLGVGTGKEDAFDFKYINLPVNVFGKYYFNPNNGNDKFYASVFLRYVNRKYSFDGAGTPIYAEYTQQRVGLGFGFGYKAVSKNGIVFEIGLGAGRAFVDDTKLDTEGAETSIDWPKLMFAGKLGVGYRFGGK